MTARLSAALSSNHGLDQRFLKLFRPPFPIQKECAYPSIWLTKQPLETIWTTWASTHRWCGQVNIDDDRWRWQSLTRKPPIGELHTPQMKAPYWPWLVLYNASMLSSSIEYLQYARMFPACRWLQPIFLSIRCTTSGRFPSKWIPAVGQLHLTKKSHTNEWPDLVPCIRVHYPSFSPLSPVFRPQKNMWNQAFKPCLRP